MYLRRKRYSKSDQDTPQQNLFVSILIPARNEVENLTRLIPSILSQSYSNFELIIYDDASEDGTRQTVNSFEDERVRLIEGNGPPPGWAGKVNALYSASATAQGDAYLYLDADTFLLTPDGLAHIVHCFLRMPDHSVMTAMPDYRGGGLTIVSLMVHALLAAIPWDLVRRVPFSSLSALNGLCWMIDADTYKRLAPHKEVADQVLEDVMIGRYLKRNGIFPELVDLQRELAVYMYSSFSDAWKGFRKNVYLLMGGRPVAFILFFAFYALIFIVPPFLDPALLLPVFFNKLLTDRRSGIPFSISLITPLSYLLGSTLQLDSTWNHLAGKVAWKGRTIPTG